MFPEYEKFFASPDKQPWNLIGGLILDNDKNNFKHAIDNFKTLGRNENNKSVISRRGNNKSALSSSNRSKLSKNRYQTKQFPKMAKKKFSIFTPSNKYYNLLYFFYITNFLKYSNLCWFDDNSFK